jgi:hypothetical protein
MKSETIRELIEMDDMVLLWLLHESDPCARLAALKLLLGRNDADSDVQDARASAMNTGIIGKILQKQNPDGSFGDPERFYLDKYSGTAWTLLVLAELGADPCDERVRNVCDFILDHSQDPDSGGFSMKMSTRTGIGLGSSVIPCLTGNMIYSLLRLGMAEDERVMKGIEWILKYQRYDDGEYITSPLKDYAKLTPCFGRHTCHMGAAKALKALATVPEEMRTACIIEKTDELVEYFLIHRLFKKSHDLEKVSKPGWLRLGFPLMYQTDILELLLIMADLGIQDKSLYDALDILRGKMTPDGRWIMETSNNGKMNADIEKKGSPSKWITMRALRVLEYYGVQGNAL